MRSVKLSLSVCCLCALAVVVASCSTYSKGLSQPHQETRFVGETARRAQDLFALGKFKRALELYATAFNQYHYPGLRRGYTRLGEQIRIAADTAYQHGDFAEAGSDYSILLESALATRDVAASPTFDDDYLSKQIKSCAKALMESALMKYRAEKFNEAIAIWARILQFDPGNKSVQNAYDTATAQLQRLKHISNNQQSNSNAP